MHYADEIASIYMFMHGTSYSPVFQAICIHSPT
jgi:hypothetical protein